MAMPYVKLLYRDSLGWKIMKIYSNNCPPPGRHSQYARPVPKCMFSKFPLQWHAVQFHVCNRSGTNTHRSYSICNSCAMCCTHDDTFLYLLGTNFDIFRCRTHVNHSTMYSGVLEGIAKYSRTEISAADAEELSQFKALSAYPFIC